MTLPCAVLSLKVQAASLIVSPVFERTFDARDVAERLQDCGFEGRYLAVIDTLPHPAVIRDEVRRAAPKLSFDVLVLDAQNKAKLH